MSLQSAVTAEADPCQQTKEVRFRLGNQPAIFCLSGHVNRQNMRVWGLENPHATAEKQKSKEKTMVWCAMTDTSVLGPFFFEDTVTGKKLLGQWTC